VFSLLIPQCKLQCVLRGWIASLLLGGTIHKVILEFGSAPENFSNQTLGIPKVNEGVL